MCADVNVKNSTLMLWLLMHYYKLFQIFCILIVEMFTVHNVHFVKYDVTVSFMAQVLDTVAYFVSHVLVVDTVTYFDIFR